MIKHNDEVVNIPYNGEKYDKCSNGEIKQVFLIHESIALYENAILLRESIGAWCDWSIDELKK